MILRAHCEHCQELCEWNVDERGDRSPAHPCAQAPGRICEPESDGTRMVRQIARDSARRAGQRARGFVVTKKRRPG